MRAYEEEPARCVEKYSKKICGKKIQLSYRIFLGDEIVTNENAVFRVYGRFVINASIRD